MPDEKKKPHPNLGDDEGHPHHAVYSVAKRFTPLESKLPMQSIAPLSSTPVSSSTSSKVPDGIVSQSDIDLSRTVDSLSTSGRLPSQAGIGDYEEY